MALILPDLYHSKGANERLISALKSSFKFDITNRLKVVADTEHFKYKEDRSVYDQAKGKMPIWFEVYWDTVWVCDFIDKDSVDAVELRFWKSFLKLYEEGKVSLNEVKIELELPKDPLVEAEKKIQALSERTEEDRIVKDTMKEVLVEKKKKRKK